MRFFTAGLHRVREGAPAWALGSSTPSTEKGSKLRENLEKYRFQLSINLRKKAIDAGASSAFRAFSSRSLLGFLLNFPLAT
jgi:hypothetical protein